MMRWLIHLWPWAEQAPPFRQMPKEPVELAIKTYAFDQVGLTIRMLDNTYYLPDRAQLEGFLAAFQRGQYLPERFDCEDHAMRLLVSTREKWGMNGVGMVIDETSAHAYNLAVLDDLSVVLIEPQDGEIVPRDELLYIFRYGLVLI